MHMTFRVAVAGCTGYAGGEVIRLLLGHPDVEVVTLTAGSNAGARFGDLQPHLIPLADQIVAETSAETLHGHDVVFLALPHGASAALAAELGEETLVIDCGADHRLKDPAQWEAFYHSDHAGTWPYGLPEMPGHREQLACTSRIAVPGCYVTTVTLGLLPALIDGVVSGQDVVVTAASGTSGAGKGAKPHLLGSETAGSMSAYGVGGVHRHIPEILQNFRELGAVDPTLSFTPMLAPMPRGIIAAITAPIDSSISLDDVRQCYARHYDPEPFVHLLPDGIWPQSQSVLGSNGCLIQVAVDRGAGRLTVISTLDNLTKGTAGGAIQSMNIALGLDETSGLSVIGVAP